MTTNWHDLIQRYISGTITEAETEALEQQLKTDPVLRDWYLDALNLDSALEAAAESAQTALSLPVPLSQRALTPVGATSTRWQGWRPLTAAAAGLVIGVFSASLVYGMRAVPDVVKHERVTIAEGSFEGLSGAVAEGFPQSTGAWAADHAEVVPGPDGGRALRLLPNDEHPYSRLVQIVDVSALHGGSDHELELAASFRTTDATRASRYKLRIFAFSETVQEVPSFPLGAQERGIVTLSQVLDVPAGTSDWQRFAIKAALPRSVKSVVIWLGASTSPFRGERVPHEVDDVSLMLHSHPAQF
jgi:anti-sigma factor RsiW